MSKDVTTMISIIENTKLLSFAADPQQALAKLNFAFLQLSNKMTPEELEALFFGDLHILNFSYRYGLKLAEREALITVLQYNKTLKELYFYISSPAHCISLGKALQNNTTLRSLELQGLNAREMEFFLENLKPNNTLTSLNLANRQCSNAKNIILISELVRNSNCLVSLGLSQWEIRPEEMLILASALEGNQSITSLNLGCNFIHDNGTIALAESLKKNKTLTALNLFNNFIADRGASALVNLLENNNTLTLLYIATNINIGHSNKRKINTYITRNLEAYDIKENIREDWCRTALLIAFQRANISSPFKDSILSLISGILELAKPSEAYSVVEQPKYTPDDYICKITPMLLSPFMSTGYFKNQITLTQKENITPCEAQGETEQTHLNGEKGKAIHR